MEEAFKAVVEADLPIADAILVQKESLGQDAS
jgi:hypothetical protein